MLVSQEWRAFLAKWSLMTLGLVATSCAIPPCIAILCKFHLNNPVTVLAFLSTLLLMLAGILSSCSWLLQMKNRPWFIFVATEQGLALATSLVLLLLACTNLGLEIRDHESLKWSTNLWIYLPGLKSFLIVLSLFGLTLSKVTKSEHTFEDVHDQHYKSLTWGFFGVYLISFITQVAIVLVPRGRFDILPLTFVYGFFLSNGAIYLANFAGLVHTWLILKSKESIYVNLATSSTGFLASFPHLTVGAVAVSIEESFLYFAYGAATFITGIMGAMLCLLTFCYSMHILKKTDLTNEDERKLNRGGSGLSVEDGGVTRSRSRSVVVTLERKESDRRTSTTNTNV